MRRRKLFWKFAVLAAMIPITVATMALVASRGTTDLKYQVDNMYAFMLIPIMGIEEGNHRRAQLESELTLLARFPLSADERAARIALVRKCDADMARVMTKYRAEWWTAVSPEFTRTLEAWGEKQLQAEETERLAQYEKAYALYAAHRDPLLDGKGDEFAAIQVHLATMDRAITDLVRINARFAELSNKDAQLTTERTRRRLAVAGMALALVALLAAWWLSRAATVPVTALHDATARLAETARDVSAQADSLRELAAFLRMDGSIPPAPMFAREEGPTRLAVRSASETQTDRDSQPPTPR